MAKIVWDVEGARLYETGVDHGVLYPYTEGAPGKGVAWNGLTTVTESPSGAESNPQYADNMKYLDLYSKEEFGFTIEAYTYPDAFEECDGSAEPIPGVFLGQQSRKPFGLSYRTKIGNDTDGEDHGYKLHLIWGAKASPSERTRSTVNDSPEAVSLSWECTTTGVVTEGYQPVSHMIIDSTKVTDAKLKLIEASLYGDTANEAQLPMPSAVLEMLKGN